MSDLILGINNPWYLLYNPSRIPKEKSALSKDSENVKKEDNNNNIDNKDGQSTNKKNEDNKKIKPMLHQEELNNEQGMVKEEEKIAEYRDSNGKLHVYSAVCTHLGCTVIWNDSEKSFDCPCHGSRFSAITGNTINGPANNKLDKKQQ